MKFASVIGCTAVIALQILWPLSQGTNRAALTVVIVCVFAATSVCHAIVRFGWRWASVFTATVLVLALLLEAIGVATGFPFGSYSYGSGLGFSVLGVPVIVPLAWLMMAYPAYTVSSRIVSGIPAHSKPLARAAIGAFAMTAWDLFLDPQMTAEGYWIWPAGSMGFPGVPGIPLTNYLGWLIGSFALMLVIQAIPQWKPPLGSEAVPAVLWMWTWVGGIIANTFFLDRPSVALVGGIAMGVVSVGYLIVVWRQR